MAQAMTTIAAQSGLSRSSASSSATNRDSVGSCSYGAAKTVTARRNMGTAGMPENLSEFWGRRVSTRSSFGNVTGDSEVELARRGECSGMVYVKAQGFNLWEVLGGRGLVGGEKAVNTKAGLEKLFSEPEGTGKKSKVGTGSDESGRVEVIGVDGFDKEMAGLVGGFPGGEKGLGEFLEKYPPPNKGSKASVELEKLRDGIGGPTTKAKTFRPPLLMPGMTVIVIEPRNPYHNFTGIVQRVTDGKVGVLFEGGNWDKLVTFKLVDLERTAGGPPMTHPKSAILLQRPATTPPTAP